MKSKIILLIIFALASFLRFYRLAEYPALNADEAAIGYNAYSLLETGKDEHGNFWPIHFQSFNDFKPGLYFYLVLPFVKVLGLNEWAVRIPGATLGVLTVILVYLIGRHLKGGNERLGILASFLLAISPWHIHFSRGGWEVNAATFFITLGVWLFLKALKNPKLYVLSLLAFIASFYTYHAARIVVPLLGIGFLILFKKNIVKDIKSFGLAALVALIVLSPLIKELLGPAGFSRAAGVGLFADPGPLNRINEQRGEHGDFRGIGALVFHNKAVNYGLAFLENLTSHFNGEFLFLSGDVIQRNRVPETGAIYLFDLIFILVGLIAIIKKPEGFGFLIWWLLVAPTASALTFQSPHALRAHNMVIPLILISAYGLDTLMNKFSKIKSLKLAKLGFALAGLIILWSFSSYTHMYWVHMAKEYPFSSQYGVKELTSFVGQNQEKFSKVLVTDRYDQPYILFLFYLKYPPQKFQENHILTPKDKFGFSTVSSFDKYVFKGIEWNKEITQYPGSLIIGTNSEIPNEANIIKRIYFPSGDIAFKVVAN